MAGIATQADTATNPQIDYRSAVNRVEMDLGSEGPCRERDRERLALDSIYEIYSDSHA